MWYLLTAFRKDEGSHDLHDGVGVLGAEFLCDVLEYQLVHGCQVLCRSVFGDIHPDIAEQCSAHGVHCLWSEHLCYECCEYDVGLGVQGPLCGDQRLCEQRQ